MSQYHYQWILAVLIGFSTIWSLPAFPTAEGFGKDTKGGRGGIVVEVTNLNNDGAGSLREALTGKSNIGKKRTVVFRVGGTIALNSQITVKNDSCITIAGQTAPGGGIAIKNFPLYIAASKEIIVRHFRSRLGDEQPCDSPNCDIDAFSVRNCHHVVLDHCSFSWAIDADLDLTVETGYSTVQYCILSEALYDSKHSKGPHSMAAGWDGNSYGYDSVFGGASYHHNLLASCNSRMPRLDSYAGENNTGHRDLMDVVNNVIYNWNGGGAYGGENADANLVNNYYRYGPSTVNNKDQLFNAVSLCKLYLSGNYMDGYPDISNDNRKGIFYNGVTPLTGQLDTIIRTSAFKVMSITTESAQQAYTAVLAKAGATKPQRDTVDKRIVGNVTGRSGAIINSQTAVGGWPVLATGTAPADSDHDGIPDDWERKHGLDPDDSADRNTTTLSTDGYTNLEMYLNELAGDPVVFKPTSVAMGQVNVSHTPVAARHGSFLLIDLPQENNVEISAYDPLGRCKTDLFTGRLKQGRTLLPLSSKAGGFDIVQVRYKGQRYIFPFFEVH